MKKELVVGGLAMASIIIGMIKGLSTPTYIEAETIQMQVASVDYYCEQVPEDDAEEMIIQKAYYSVPFTHEEQDMIRDIADMFGLEYPLVLAVMKVESDYNTQLIDDNGKSFGIMQVQPQWWQYVFETYKCTDWLNLHDNTLIGCRILSWGYERYEYDMRKALTWYNTGNPDYVNEYATRVLTRWGEIIATEYWSSEDEE